MSSPPPIPNTGRHCNSAPCANDGICTEDTPTSYQCACVNKLSIQLYSGPSCDFQFPVWYIVVGGIILAHIVFAIYVIFIFRLRALLEAPRPGPPRAKPPGPAAERQYEEISRERQYEEISSLVSETSLDKLLNPTNPPTRTPDTTTEPEYGPGQTENKVTNVDAEMRALQDENAPEDQYSKQTFSRRLSTDAVKSYCSRN